MAPSSAIGATRFGSMLTVLTTGCPKMPKGERVYTIFNYYDGPREGIADFQGKPHFYKCQFNEADDNWTDRFWLMEIDQALFELAREEYEIFLRWRAEFDRGAVKLDSHPALLADRSRFAELKAAIGNRLDLVRERSITKRARFTSDGTTHPTVAAWLVEWIAV